MSHVCVIAMAVCCCAAAVGLFIWKRWSYLPFITVSANAILGGLMGTFFGFQSLSKAITITLAGVLWLGSYHPVCAIGVTWRGRE